MIAESDGLMGSELSMGLLCVTRSNPTHQLTDPTRPNPIQLTMEAYSLVVTYFYTQIS